MLGKKLIIVLFLVLTAVSCSSCSPIYIAKASWEEAKILWRREKISRLIEDPATDEKTKAKLQLVLEAREFAKKIGLVPKESFTLYSKIDRDELVWVLSAAPKTSFSPVTWWFPIVGRIPYKGFFEKEDAEKEAKKFQKKGNDVFIRPSAAFSTLGWFNDPLLSTTIKSDEINLVDTVIHEILHNTIFIKNHVDFNETLANFIGAYGACQFFYEKYGAEHPLTKNCSSRFEKELAFSSFLETLISRLNKLYERHKSKLREEPSNHFLLEETLKEKHAIIENSLLEWNSSPGKSKVIFDKNKEINNATIIASKIYLTKTSSFLELYQCSSAVLSNKTANQAEGEIKSLLNYVEFLKKMSENIIANNLDPYEELQKEISKTCRAKSVLD